MPPKLVVYAGAGSSHSWTWLADLLEANTFGDVRFLDDRDFAESVSDRSSIAVISGGDAYAIASALSMDGFARLERFIRSGGRYVGICAGAYLPLPTSVPPLSGFNLCSAKIENIVRGLPTSGSEPPRLSVGYCDKRIIHPVRGEVLLSCGDISVKAPVYGGPVFREPSDERVLGRFSGFTEKTEVQIDAQSAREMVLGRPAVIEARCGKGRMLLLSPHLEHPLYPEANLLFMGLLRLPVDGAQNTAVTQPVAHSSKGELSRAVADLAVSLHGLEGRSFIIGNKIWDSERFLVLLEAVRKRSVSLPEDVAGGLAARLHSIRMSLLDTPVDSSESINTVLDSLMCVTRDCVNLRFEQMSDGR
jgi:hypothetical protein